MVKIGEAYVDLKSVEAITPMRECDGYALFLAGGRIVGLSGVTEAEVLDALEAGGCLDPQCVTFTPSLAEQELAELHTLWKCGFRYVARDRSGKVFAYASKPTKGEDEWEGADDSMIRRVNISSCEELTFEAGNMLDLGEIFGGAEA